MHVHVSLWEWVNFCISVRVFYFCSSAGMIVHLSVCVCANAYLNVRACVCVCLGEDVQHGAGQRPRRGTGSGQSVTADPTVRGFFGGLSCNCLQCIAQQIQINRS